MNPEIKAMWVAALRSGEYKQGKGVLRTRDNCFCALGVLADVAAKRGVAEWHIDDDGDWIINTPDDDHIGFATLPPCVMRWSSLPAGGPDLTIDGEQTNVVSMNDGDGGKNSSFAEIANAIEEQL
jgi:hypothetical protein